MTFGSGAKGALAGLGNRWAQEHAAEKRRLADAKADGRAVWALADQYLPADVMETAERHKMSETMREIWRAAFIAGWRARDRAEG